MLVSIGTGYLRGFVLQAATLAGGIAGLLIAKANYPNATDFLANFFPKTGTLAVVAFILVFLLVWLLVGLGAQAARAALRLMFLGFFDRLAGAVFGAAQGILLVEVLLVMGGKVHDPTIHSSLHDSHLAGVFRDALPGLHRLIPKNVNPPLR